MNSNDHNQLVEVTIEKGSGRAFLFLVEDSKYLDIAKRCAEALADKGRAIVLKVVKINGSIIDQLSDQILKKLSELKVRQASYVGFGAASSLVQSVALMDLKMVRTMVLVDATTRPHPSMLLRWIDKIERSLPLGLPWRLDNDGFDSKPFLHRLRCPVLVCCTSVASDFEKAESELLEHGLPTAWRVDLSPGKEGDELGDLCAKFYDVPAKCPQKGVNL